MRRGALVGFVGAVHIEVHGDGRGGMTEPLLCRLDVLGGVEQGRGGRMAPGVNRARLGDSCAALEVAELLRHRFRNPRTPARPGKHEQRLRAVVPAPRQSIGRDSRALLPQQLPEGRRQHQEPP